VGLEGEALGEDVLDGAGASLDLEDAVAESAVEVVVVCFSGGLVAWWLAGEFDGGDLAGGFEELEGAVDGGDAEGGDVGLGGVEDFGGGDGAIGVVDGVVDGGALAGGAGHRVMLEN